MSESFKPTPISAPSSTGYPWIFKIRCLIDLQMNTCLRFLRPDLAKIQGNILDVGAGQSPWRSFLPKGTLYQGIDISNSTEYGMEKEMKDIVYYDGKIMPFSDRSFDNVLCTEVLEHVADPELLLREIDRVLKDNGKIFFTIPWSARRHHIPYDFLRFTREKLEIMFAEHGFSNLVIKERGNDVCVIFNKILVLNIRLLKPEFCLEYILNFFFGICLLPFTFVFLIASHIAINFNSLTGSEDPLGYYITGEKRNG